MKRRRCPDAAPCEVIVAEFVFGVTRCRADAMHEVQMDGEWFRCCAEHLREIAGAA